MNITKKYLLFATGLIAFGLMSCEEEHDINMNVGTVPALVLPANNESIVLSSTGSTNFQWEPTTAEDGGSIIYEIVFDKVGGDFSNPCYVISSDGKGGKASAKVAHKLLNIAADSAGIPHASTGTFIWTIRTSKGLNAKTSSAFNTITVSRLKGFAVIPIRLYINGAAIEASATDKHTFNKGRNYKDELETGVFEIFAQLKTGQLAIFDNTGKTYCINLANRTLRDSSAITNIPASMNDKVYRIRLDFSTAKAAVSEIKEIRYQHASKQYNATPSVYLGKGSWLIGDCPLVNGDDRYKFLVTTEPLGDIISFCAIANSNTPAPGNYTGSDASSFIRQVAEVDKPNVQEGSRPWDEYTAAFKYNAPEKGKTGDFTIHMNSDFAHYTHSLVIK